MATQKRIAGLYEDYVVRLRNVKSKDAIKIILRQVIDLGQQRALNQVEVNSLIRIGEKRLANDFSVGIKDEYQARGGLNTYKPGAAFGAKDVGI